MGAPWMPKPSSVGLITVLSKQAHASFHRKAPVAEHQLWQQPAR